jgi:NMD protein affecting ribosome stability and mRNA decay
MGVETFDCAVCDTNGIHEDYIFHCACGAHVCVDCYKEGDKRFSMGDDGAFIFCPICISKKELADKMKKYELMVNHLLIMYNKKRKNKLTFEQLQKLVTPSPQ